MEKLKIDKKLPQIIIPSKKIEMFREWWNKEIRFETIIPQTFNEGYLFLENDYKIDINNFSQFIKLMARCFETTYRDIENQLKHFLDASTSFILYFKFIGSNEMLIRTYDNNNELMSNITFAIGEGETVCEPIMNTDELLKKITTEKTLDGIINAFNFNNIGILLSCLWYIATTTKTTKYIYEKKTPKIEKRYKNLILVSSSKTISTPIYDMNKIKIVKVESLTARKKGWTYSHSFQVHGHYRHYRTGKTIFINSYVKGQDKEFKSQQLILSPKEL